MNDEREVTQKSGTETSPNLDEMQAKGTLFLQTREGEIIDLLKSVRRELSSYEQDSSAERERILDRLTPVIENLQKLLSESRPEWLKTKLNMIDKTTASLKKIIEERSTLVKELRQENKQLRNDFIFEEKIKPGVFKLIKLRDNVSSQLRDNGPGTNEIFLEAVEEKLMGSLRSFGVTEVQISGDEFDPARQEVVEKAEVLEKRKHKKVLEVLQPGYRNNKQVIRPQKVIIGDFTGGETGEQD